MTLSRVAFRHALRRLGSSEARAFVADLLDARGFRPTVDGMVVTATDGPVESMRLLVVADPRPLRVTGHSNQFDAVVVTGGPVASAVGSLAVRLDRNENTPDVHGPELLYEWFAFAVDSAARASLADRYLGATEPTALARVWAVLVGGYGESVSLLDRLPFPLRRGALVVLAALVVLTAATAIGPAGPVGSTLSLDDGIVPAGEPTPQITSVPVTVTPVPVTAEASRPVPEGCPQPPLGTHPAALRPGVIRTASTGGLEGWRLLVTQNTTRYEFDPNDQQAGLVPEVRHTAVFETPADEQFRLVMDRWESAGRADTAVTRGGPWQLGFAWGTYVVGVEWDPDGTAGEPSARVLLAGVRTPDGTMLGEACVSELLASTTTNASA